MPCYDCKRNDGRASDAPPPLNSVCGNARVVKPADQDRARLIWAEIEAHRDNHTTLKGRVLNPMNSGYSVGVGGVVGFLPFSLCSLLTASKVGLLQVNPTLKTFSQDG